METRRKSAWAPTGLWPRDYDDDENMNACISRLHKLSMTSTLCQYITSGFKCLQQHYTQIFLSQHYLQMLCKL